MSTKTKNIIKYIIVAVVCVALIAGAIALISSLVKKDDGKDTIGKSAYDIGGINEVGEFEESKGTLYTTESYPVEGLEITVDFENTINYQVFFYDESGKFISSSDVLNTKFADEIPATATSFRIEITPDWEELEITDEDDMTISWYEVGKYAKQLTVKIDEE